MLKLNDIKTFYGQSQILFGMTLEVKDGEVVTLMGRNGMGKTTTIRSIMGLTPARAGSIYLDGQEIRTMMPYKVARLGLALALGDGAEPAATLVQGDGLLDVHGHFDVVLGNPPFVRMQVLARTQPESAEGYP